MKQFKNHSGFTIVELLIVIVVIGILAALVISTYSGVQNRAKTARAQDLAQSVSKKAEAYQAVKSQYPTNRSQFASVPEAKIDDMNSFTAATAPTAATYNQVEYLSCASGAGYQVVYYDLTTPGTVTIGGGTQTGCTAPTT